MNKEQIIEKYDAATQTEKRKITGQALYNLSRKGIKVTRQSLANWRKNGDRTPLNKAYTDAYRKAMIVRSSKLAEQENIILHDQYLRETRPEMMGEYVNS